MGVLGFIIGLFLIWFYILFPKKETRERIAMAWDYRHIKLDKYDDKKIFQEAEYNETEIENMINESPYRNFWGREYIKESFIFEPAMMKYIASDVDIETSLNLEYLFGYQGYYNKNTIIPNQASGFLRRVNNLRDNEKYFSPLYYYYNCAEQDNDILSLLGKKMSVEDFDLELKKRQYFTYFDPGEHSPWYSTAYPIRKGESTSFFTSLIMHGITCRNRKDIFYIDIDVKDRIHITNVPKFEYTDNGLVKIKCKVSGTDTVYDDKPFGFLRFVPMGSTIELIGVKCNIPYKYRSAFNFLDKEGYITKNKLPTEEELYNYKERMVKRNETYKEEYGYKIKNCSICYFCGKPKEHDVQLVGDRFICKECRKKGGFKY